MELQGIEPLTPHCQSVRIPFTHIRRRVEQRPELPSSRIVDDGDELEMGCSHYN